MRGQMLLFGSLLLAVGTAMLAIASAATIILGRELTGLERLVAAVVSCMWVAHGGWRRCGDSNFGVIDDPFQLAATSACERRLSAPRTVETEDR